MKSVEFNRILVANRGEIACRIVRAIHELDKIALVIYADNDRELPFVEQADEAWALGPGDLSSTYMNIGEIVRIALEGRADAIHPGYGFLSENAEFARACEESGIHFIGPSAEVISLMGHKSRAREIASNLGLQVPEGETGDLGHLLENRSRLPFPLLIKPAAGGGGKGMRIVHAAEAFEQEAKEASEEALKYFGSGELYVERYLEGSRHIEVQVIADSLGNMVHLFERECSVQRRYQKIIEEAPSGFISEETRQRITSAAMELIRGIGYTNAGTIEFLVDPEQEFYFMEMNTRIQVEHPVTEVVTGLDLVKEQIAIAGGLPLSFKQTDVALNGHAIEARIYAEDPGNGYLPSSGILGAMELPGGRGIRIDNGYRAGNRVETWYDPMLAKIIVKGKDREDARNKLIGALKETHITGLSTNRDFLVGLLGSGLFKENRIHTGFLDRSGRELLLSMQGKREKVAPETLLAAAAFISLYRANEEAGDILPPWQQIGYWRMLPQIKLRSDQEDYMIQYRSGRKQEVIWLKINDRESTVLLEQKNGHNYTLRVDGRLIRLWGITDRSEILMDTGGHRYICRRPDVPDRRYIRQDKKKKERMHGEISAPLNGKVVRIHVKEGDRVAEGDAMIVIESMKMENKILSDHEAIVQRVEISAGQYVQTNQTLLTLESI